MKRTKIFIFIAMTLILVGCSSSKINKLERYDREFYETFDTVINISIYSDDKKFAKDNLQFAEDRFKELTKIFDNYKTYTGVNNVKTINDNAGIKPIEVDETLFNLIEFSIDNYHNYSTNNNIAMGPVIKKWNSYRELYENGSTEDEVINELNSSLPLQEELESLRDYINIDKIKLDKNNKTVFIDEGMSIDLGATAKGYATEIVAKELEERGVNSAIISAGGNVRIIGLPGDGREYFKIGIQNPDLNSDKAAILVMKLKGDVSAVTSGDYQRYFEVDGKRYSHIINPDTLAPTSKIKSLTVINKDSGLADFLSTAAFNSTDDEIKKMAKETNSEIIWIDENFKIHMTEGAAKYIEK
ncbi:thiamine biosynthesis lipoprotein [Peptoniphilus olsenii]|uniref:FAD:protein FMN transferase n=1 Tax=Peptoniphilus olsenii TaxID=411570 RepID=A0ABV2JBW6_9FIRM